MARQFRHQASCRSICAFLFVLFFCFFHSLKVLYASMLEGAILETGNNWFLDMVQGSIKQVRVISSNQRSLMLPIMTC